MAPANPIGVRDGSRDLVRGETRGARVLFGLWWRANRLALTRALFIFIVLRVLLSLVTLLTAGLLPLQAGLHDTYQRSYEPALDAWARWDSEYYLDIAAGGYAARPQLAVFFPLYPMLIAAVAPIFQQDLVLAGIVVSSLACLVALFYMFKLAALELGEASAERAMLYMAIYPMALFMFAVYTESLFLAVLLATFYYTRRGRWGPAAIGAFLAGVTRPTGLVLVFPLAYEAWRQACAGQRLPSWRALLGSYRLPAVAAAPLAWLLFAVYLAWLTGDPAAILHSRALPPFWRQTSLPWDTLGLAFQNLQRTDLSLMARTVNTTDLIATLMLIETALVAWWALPRAYAIYATASIVLLLTLTISEWPLQSMPRYSLAVFPLFFLLARLGANRYWHQAIVMVSLLFLGLYTALFANWYWVF
ncbi:MAG TPA: hypothetical protein VM536_05960 [Chloroflexia bacterium]|nr:hypothetical protein [Chloroflexia bacterium]